MPLHLLPTELLTLVAKHLGEPDLKHLASTSRRFYGVFNPFLYKIDKFDETKRFSLEECRLGAGILRAARKGVVAAVRRFIDSGSNEDNYHRFLLHTALDTAITHGNTQVAELLLEHEVDMEYERNGLVSVLDRALKKEHPRHIVELILRFKPSVDRVLRSSGRWSLFSLEFVRPLRKYVIQAGLVETSRGWDAGQVLQSSALDDDMDDVVAVLEWEKTVNPESPIEYWGGLSAAVLNGNFEIVKVIAQAALDRPHGWDPQCKSSALFLALQCGNLEIARYFIDQGVPLNIPQTDEDDAVQPALGAAASGDVAVLDFVLDLGADMLGNGPQFSTALHYVFGHQAVFFHDPVTKIQPEISGHRIPMLRRLLELGADVDGKSSDRISTPLNLAILSKDMESMEFLLEHGASPHKPCARDNPPIWNALINDFVPAVKLLLRHGVDVDTPRRNMTPLNQAVSDSLSVEMLRLLLDAGADLHAQNFEGHTPLINAALYNSPDRLEKLRLLLEYGASVNEQGGCEGAALTHAISTSDLEATKLLLDHGADIHMFTPDGQNCLHDAIIDHHASMVKLLLEYGADVTERTKQGRLPLYLAVEMNARQDMTEVITMLLDRNAPITEVIIGGQTPLMWAMRRGRFNVPVIALLLERGASANVQNRKGLSPLHIAVCQRNFTVTALLLKHGADVNAQDRKGSTPLMRAVLLREYPEKRLMKLLLEYEPDLTLRNRKGKTATEMLVEQYLDPQQGALHPVEQLSKMGISVSIPMKF